MAHEMNPVADVIPDYESHLRTERQLSALTVQNYVREATDLSNWLEGIGITAWKDVVAATVRDYVASRRRNGAGGRTIQRVLSGLRSLFAYLRSAGILSHDPCRGIKAPKATKPLPQVPDPDEMAALVSNGGSDVWLERRDDAIFELTYSCGLRVSEVASLDVDSVDFEARLVRVIGKRNKERIVPVGRAAAAALRVWLDHRSIQAPPESTALFVSARGKRIATRTIQARLERRLQMRGLPSHIHPHTLRHAFASHVLQSSGDLRAVQELLGHADIGTTQVYTHLDFQHLSQIYDNAHPRAKRRKS